MSERTAIVTGAASGLGLALSAELAQRGAFVVLSDVDRGRGNEAAAALRAAGGRCEFVAADVTRFEQVEALVAGVFERHGRLDLLVNNAGRGVLGEVRDMELRHWDALIDLNLRGVVHGVHAAWSRMARQGFGQVLNTASLAGLMPAPTGAAYSATKHAVVALSLALREEGRGLGLKCSVACPGFVRTGFGASAEYLGVRREELFPPTEEDPETTRRFARRILTGAERDRAIITTPAWVRVAWWLQRAAPGLVGRVVGARILARHRSERAASAGGAPLGEG